MMRAMNARREHPMARERGAALAAFAVFFASPGVAFLGGVLGRPGSPTPFLATLVLHALIAAYLVWRLVAWVRPVRRATARDFLILLMIPGMVAALLLVLAIASGNGIQGSALPRLRLGRADALDVSYLLAVTAALVALAVALALTALLAVSGLHFRAPRPPREPKERTVRPLSYSTGEADGYWRRVVSRSTRVLMVVGAAVAALALVLVLTADASLASASAYVVMLASVPAVAWSVLQSLWRPDRGLGVVMAALYRTMVMPFFAAVPVAVVFLLAVALPPAWRAYETREWRGSTWDGPLPGDEATLLAWCALVLFVGILVSLLVGLALSVFVVSPVLAFWWPEQYIGDNLMSRAPADRARNVLAVRALSLLIPLIFVVVTLLVVFEPGDGPWWLGLLLVPVGVAALVVVVRAQRPDHAARDTRGVSGRVGRKDS